MRGLVPGRAIPSAAAVGRRKRGHGNELRLRHRRNHHLRDALTTPNRERRIAVIDQEHGDLAAKHGITVLNSPGTVDADYRGEVSVLLINHGDAPFAIRRGERIAQMVIAPVAQAQLVAVATLSTTDRGSGGYGSTGR